MKNNIYRCPKCSSMLDVNVDALSCSAGHTFEMLQIGGVLAPVFDCEKEEGNDYAAAEAAKMNENATNWVLNTFNSTEVDLRKNLISRLHLKPGQKVLITGTGAGADLPFLVKNLGEEGEIFAQDYSKEMLQEAIKRAQGEYELSKYNIEFSVSDATNLPYVDDYFDAVYHFGGINLFSDIAKGISEMDRVAKDGGRIVFGDEGIASWLKDTEYGKMVINNNKLCDYDPPLDLLPKNAKDVNLSWAAGNCFYIVDYTKSTSPLPINIDIPHIGKRGGTIRTRYFGQLEGVDPELKDKIYFEAEKKNVSRVAFLEKLLREGLKGN
ncbi:class I SAM-dependent methyltransferase [Eionea flava]